MQLGPQFSGQFGLRPAEPLPETLHPLHHRQIEPMHSVCHFACSAEFVIALPPADTSCPAPAIVLQPANTTVRANAIIAIFAIFLSMSV